MEFPLGRAWSVHRGAVRGFSAGIVPMCRSPAPRLLGLCLSWRWRPAHGDDSRLQLYNIYVQLGWTSIVYYSVFGIAGTNGISPSSLLGEHDNSLLMMKWLWSKAKRVLSLFSRTPSLGSSLAIPKERFFLHSPLLIYINLVRIAVEICTTWIFHRWLLSSLYGPAWMDLSWVHAWTAFGAFAASRVEVEELYIFHTLFFIRQLNLNRSWHLPKK